MSAMRRCGVEFEKLSKEQGLLLKDFIRDHALRNVADYNNIKSLSQSDCSCATPEEQDAVLLQTQDEA